MWTITFLVLTVSSALVLAQTPTPTAPPATSANRRNLFDSLGDCQRACIGEHDTGCASIRDGGPQHLCRCAPSFYSMDQTCQEECENQQYWSLFTYGSCAEYQTSDTLVPGACNKQCVLKVRVWTTVFMIISFVAAVIIIIATLPNCIINCVACMRVRKQQRTMDDMHVGGDTGGPKGGASYHSQSTQQQVSAGGMSPYHQQQYYGYYGQQQQQRA